jgi:hypothetical protein
MTLIVQKNFHKLTLSEKDNETLVKSESNVFGNHELVFPYKFERVKEAVTKWQNGAYMQEVFRFMNEDEREFLISGIAPAQWNKMFKENGDG